MQTFRKHWFDIAGILAAGVLVFVCLNSQLNRYNMIVWLNLASLFLHQLEEYRIIGTFPGMINEAIFKSKMPDRFPLNTNTAVIVNVYLGWTSYLLAALFGMHAIWLGIATTLVSVGNIIAHTFLFNIKNKSLFNAGMLTSWLFFAPLSFYFFKTIHSQHLVRAVDYLLGIPVGIVLNVFILKFIDWFADKNTSYIFEQHNLLLKQRTKS